jgi:hypothetical protein
VSSQATIGLIGLATAMGVGADAHALGVKRGRLGGGFLDMSVTGWVLSCFFLWIVGLPCYLVARGRYQAMKRQAAMYPAAYPAAGGFGWPQTAGAWPRAQAAATVSPDGRWWWNGQQWMPMPAPGAWPGT